VIPEYSRSNSERRSPGSEEGTLLGNTSLHLTNMESPSQLEFNRLLIRKQARPELLDRVGHRPVLDGVSLPTRRVLAFPRLGSMTSDLGGGPLIWRHTWKSLHFRNCNLSELTLMSCALSDCVFEHCNLAGIGLWGTLVQDCRFEHCDMPSFGFGGINISNPKKTNRYSGMVITGGSMRGSLFSCEPVDRCKLLNCDVRSVNYKAAILTHCVFEGTLQDVIFERRSRSFPKKPPNLLLGCDFRKTRLIDVVFRNIDLDLSMLPLDKDLIVLPRGPLDWLEWGALTGHTWFAKQRADGSGTPTITRLSELRPEISDDDIRKLAEVADQTQT